MLAWLLLIPFFVQGIAIFFDESIFHIKRGLPLWERIGHPLDTLTTLLCLGFILLVPYSDAALKWYIGLALFSCLFVTKDEWVHKHHCPPMEQWLHALLFLNHPIVLTAAGLMWASPALGSLQLYPFSFYRLFLIGQALATTGFMFYQIIYWNWVWQEKK